MIIQTAGRLYWTAVATAWGIIMKPPSPQTVMQGASGLASFAPKTPQTPKPMAANPPAVKWVPGFSEVQYCSCLLYTSDAADDLLCVDLGGRRIIKKKKEPNTLHSS